MASIYKTSGGWRVQVARKGVRKSRTFQTKAAAEAWALREERAILDGDVSRWPQKTVRDACDKYETEVTPRKRSAVFEVRRLRAFVRDFPELASTIISEVAPADLAAWRDTRLKTITPGSVRRESNLLRHVWTIAAKEWGWCQEPGPWRSIRVPSDNPARSRIATWREIRVLLRRTGYTTGQPPTTPMGEVGWAFLVSLRTGLRASEVLGLHSENVSLQTATLKLPRHKTSGLVGVRSVPLTPQAVRLLGELCRSGPLFRLSSSSLDTLFRKARDQCLITDLHFHDARATALTHLSRKLDPMALARVSGHKDLNLLLNVYYRMSAEDIAKKLAERPKPR